MAAEQKRRRDEFMERGFRCGSIVRVAMKNFLTYDDAVAHPGPQLNVVLG